MIPKLLRHLKKKHQGFESFVMRCLHAHGLWRGKLPGANNNFTLGRCYTIFLGFWFPVMLLGVLMYINQNSEGDLYAKAAPYTDLFLFLVMEVHIIRSQTKIFEEQIERYYDKIHLSNYKYHDELTTQVLDIAEERCFKLFRMLNWLLILAPLSYITIPVLINFRNGAYSDHSIPMETSEFVLLPFEYKHNNVNWIFATIIFTANTVTLCYFIFYYNMLAMFIIIHLSGHMEILKSSVLNISKNMNLGKVIFTDEEDEDIFKRIRCIVLHHNSILKSLHLLKQFYGPSVFISYTYDAVAICVVLLVLFQNPMNFVRYGGLAAAVALQLGGQSYAMEQINTSVDELNIAISGIPWYAMSKRNMKSVGIMVVVSQRPFVFNAFGVVRVNLQAMASILKSSLSYFLWLYTMGQQE